LSTDLDPPADFMQAFSEKHEFITGSFSAQSIAILFTMIVFDGECEMGSSREARAYLRQLHAEVEPTKKCIRIIYALVEELIAADKMVAREESSIVRMRTKALRFVKDAFLGAEGACLAQFRTLNPRDIANRFANEETERNAENDGITAATVKIVAEVQCTVESGAKARSLQNSEADQVCSTAAAPDVLPSRVMRPNVRYYKSKQLQLTPEATDGLTDQLPFDATGTHAHEYETESAAKEPTAHVAASELEDLRRSCSMLQSSLEMKDRTIDALEVSLQSTKQSLEDATAELVSLRAMYRALTAPSKPPPQLQDLQQLFEQQQLGGQFKSDGEPRILREATGGAVLPQQNRFAYGASLPTIRGILASAAEKRMSSHAAAEPRT